MGDGRQGLPSALDALDSDAHLAPGPAPADWVCAALVRILQSERHGEAVRQPGPFPDGAEQEVLVQIRRHRLVPLFAAHARALGLPEGLATKLSAGRRHWAGRGLQVTADTAVLSGALHAAGVDHLFIKGVALSTLLTGEPSTRGHGDVDIWVRPESAEQVETVLAEMGWAVLAHDPAGTRSLSGWRSSLYRFAVHESEWGKEARAMIDVHWRIAHHQRSVGFDFDEAYRRSVPLPTVGPHVRTLCPADALAHVVEHGRKEAFPTLRSLVDIVQLVDLCGPEAAGALAARNRTVQLGLAVAAHVAPDLARLHRPTRRQRRLAATAWEWCRSLELGGAVRRELPRRERVKVAARHKLWDVASAPSLASAATYALRFVVLTVVFGRAPWTRSDTNG